MSTILLGFSADPIERWLWPEAKDYLNCIPLYDAFAGGAITAGSAYVTDNFESVALWFPPGEGPNEEKVIEILNSTVKEDTLKDAIIMFEAMDEFHPDEPCWYLPLIAVDPAHQGCGFGTELMKRALNRCDQDGLPAYLESTNPRNISLYERYGFEKMGEVQTGSSPVMTPMIRSPRK
ncbi:MAG: N-acetyltransferase [Motiliproteus sp.]